MRFGDIKFHFNPQEEGYCPAEFTVRELSKLGYDLAGKDALEIGPKHGIHTRMLDAHGPKSITCIELPNKRGVNETWRNLIRSPLDLVYCDLLRFQTAMRYDVILFCGVLYHNTEQLRLLKKLRTFTKTKETLMVFECSTTRNPELMNMNVIEVHWPKTYRDVPTIMFHPSKLACRSLLEIAGWDIIADADFHSDLTNPERSTLLCRASDRVLETYGSENVDHAYVE